MANLYRLFLGEKMLNLVRDTLLSNHLLKPWDKPIYEIIVTKETVLTIQALLPNNVLYHIRLLQLGSDQEEYKNYLLAQQTYQQFVPPLLAHAIQEPWEIFIARGVRHRAVTPARILGGDCCLAGKIIEFFLAGSNRGSQAPAASHRQFLQQLRERMSDPACLSILDRWIAQPRLDSLPHIPQHGDFTASNFGETNAGLVIFDWEDFGRVNLPGFDLFILLASSLKFAVPKLLDAKWENDDGYGKLVEQSCAVMNLSTQMFRELVPLYLVIFLTLKETYSHTIYEMTRNAILALPAEEF